MSQTDIVAEALRDHRRHQLEARFALLLSPPCWMMPCSSLPLTGSPQSPRAFSREWGYVAANIGLAEITFPCPAGTPMRSPRPPGSTW